MQVRILILHLSFMHHIFTLCFNQLQHLHFLCHQVMFRFVFVEFSKQLWLFNGQVDDSTAGDFFFTDFNGTEHGSHPSLTTRDRELVSLLEVRIEPGELNPRPLAPQSVTLPTLPRVVNVI